MSKSIIVIDTPNTCGECLFNQIYNPSFCSDLTVCTAVKNRLFIWQDDKPKWCPLRPLPNRKEDLHYPCNEYLQAVNEGWNVCLDEITGETE